MDTTAEQLSEQLGQKFGRYAALALIAGVTALATNCFGLNKPPAADLIGSVRVIDADTIELTTAGGKETVRLAGVDAPETTQTCTDDAGATWPCGEQASAALKTYVTGKRISCVTDGLDRYQRRLGQCYVGEVELQIWLVSQGWALDYPQYSKGRYEKEQQQAQQQKIGMWRGTFETPSEWRKQQ